MKTAIKKPKLTDAQRMARLHPTTFEVPTKQALANLKAGSIVKVCVNSKERMWAVLQKQEDKGWVAKLDNRPVVVKMSYGDTFRLEPKHIYAIWED